jgi:hypothetical protein
MQLLGQLSEDQASKEQKLAVGFLMLMLEVALLHGEDSEAAERVAATMQRGLNAMTKRLHLTTQRLLEDIADLAVRQWEEKP